MNSYYIRTHRVLHIPEPRQATRMEGDIFRRRQERSLQNVEIRCLCESLKIIVFGKQFRLGGNGQCQKQIVAQFRANRADKLRDIIFRGEFLQVQLQAVNVILLDCVDQTLKSL